MIRRINLYAGPGVGKSTLAAGIFYKLKTKDIKIEILTEVAKCWAYEGRQIKLSSDQLMMFCKQKRKEELYLNNGSDLIVTDSPILLSSVYARLLGVTDDIEAMLISESAFEKKFPSLNIFLVKNRVKEEYQNEGRYQTFEEAVALDYKILNTIKGTGRIVHEIPYDDLDGAVSLIEKEISKK